MSTQSRRQASVNKIQMHTKRNLTCRGHITDFVSLQRGNIRTLYIGKTSESWGREFKAYKVEGNFQWKVVRNSLVSHLGSDTCCLSSFHCFAALGEASSEQREWEHVKDVVLGGHTGRHQVILIRAGQNVFLLEEIRRCWTRLGPNEGGRGGQRRGMVTVGDGRG